MLAFLPYRTKRFTIFASHLPMHTHTHTHWWWQSFHARCWPDHREQHGVQCLAQGHFDTWTGRAGGIEPATPNVLTRDFQCCFILSLKILNYRYFRITVINFGVFTIHCPIFLMESGVLAGNLSCKFIKVLKECTSKHILIETFVLCPLDSINTSNHLVDLQLISSKFKLMIHRMTTDLFLVLK